MNTQSQSQGRIEVIAGCMFSGKTRHLIERLTEAGRHGMRVGAIKHGNDDRYDATHLIAHDGARFPAQPIRDARRIPDLSDGLDVVAIDEAQFFGAPLPEVVAAMRAAGRWILIAGIDHNAWGDAFDPMPRLIAMADVHTQTCAPCTRCGAPARFSQRMTPIDRPDMVGGRGQYEPRCAACFVPLPRSTPGRMPFATAMDAAKSSGPARIAR